MRGTQRKWKRLWENNKQMIKDPNKIYAGFYLYYTLTPAEREDFKRRKGYEPEPEVHQAPLAQNAPAAQSRAIASVKPKAVAPAPVAQPAPQVVQAPAPAPAAPQAENIPAPTDDSPAPPQAANQVQRDPASVILPPAKAAVAPAPTTAAVAPPAVVPDGHSADLNEVIERAQKDDSNAAIPATAGP